MTLSDRFSDDELGLREAAARLAELNLHLRSTTATSSQAKDQWSMITSAAEHGVITPIKRRGRATLVIMPAAKLAQMAAQLPSEMTFGDFLQNHEGVKAEAVPRPKPSGGRVTRVRLPAGKPAVKP